MLNKLLIRNFTITEKVDIDWSNGMTTITGETGAGKSIMLNALKIVLGDRVSPSIIKEGADKCEIVAIFNVGNDKKVLAQLKERDLEDEDDPTEMMIRRVINKTGSKCFINDIPVKMNAVKELTKDLIDIHSQSEHHNLLVKELQLELLDEYANVLDLKESVYTYAKEIKANEKLVIEKQDLKNANTDKVKLLNYQMEELIELDIKEGDVEELEDIYKKMENASSYKESLGEAIDVIFESEMPIINQLSRINANLPDLEELSNVKELLSQSIIDLEETKSDLTNTLDNMDMDEEEWADIQSRLNLINSVSKKHHVLPEDLYKVKDEMQEELDSLSCSDEDIESLQEEIEELKKNYHVDAKKLSSSRHQAAKFLSKKVSTYIERLKISANAFIVEVNKHGEEDGTIDLNGYETIEFMFCPNPGTPFASLSKIASGGELSRVSLAIQLALAEVAKFNTLMFDEVDVGIGGNTAAVVGAMLEKLGRNGQVICITHQAQVAAQGQQHLLVKKDVSNGSTQHGMYYLDKIQREEEIGRMLAGHEVTEHTLNHARDLLNYSDNELEYKES
jgi:DNA repair protein RecN (Recombination protein N)